MCDDEQLVRRILLTALARTYDGMASHSPRELWNRCLGRAFRDEFPEPEFRVYFRGSPRKYMHDIVVAKIEQRPAPYNITRWVERVKYIWQCESEISLKATELVKDIGKLVAGTAASKLLVAGTPSRDNLQPWLECIEWAAAYMSGNFFLALMPSYASEATGSRR